MTVEEHAPCGVFVRLADTNVPGLIEIVSLAAESTPYGALPAIGLRLRARVLDFTASERQVRLTTKPSQLPDVAATDG